ncbi:MAG: hypothetical protein HY055_02980 [Magnetospirillum sp.]|nr:hypothetical protein [Magnetospirillum sp.]
MPIAVKSSLDVAFWISDQALNDREYIQPQKMHRLLYLAQAYFAVAYNGRKLMPATFVTDAFGPVEPTVFHALAYGRPAMLEGGMVSDQVSHFLDGIWRRYGPYTADQLTKKLAEHAPIAMAMAKGINEEIPFADMVAYYLEEAAARKSAASSVDHIDQVVKPRMLRSQTGKAVTVSTWKPKAAPAKKDE